MVFLLIVVDTKRILEYIGYFIDYCKEKKNNIIIGYFYIFVLTQNYFGEMDSIFINCC